jgi:HNH endonuclease/NUMOD4 motif
MTEAEEWLPVLGWEDYYEVSSHGRMRSLPRKYRPGVYLLKPFVSGAPYPQVKMSRRNTPRYAFVHHLVAQAFIGPRPPGEHIRHLDGDPTNNHVSNLRYGTPSENSYDTVRHGRNRNATKTRCKRGHSLTDPANLKVTPRQRKCRTCIVEDSRAQRQRRRQRA